MALLYIRDKEGFRIEYDDSRREFRATKGNVSIKADTERELDDLIKKHQRDERKFKAVEVIMIGEAVKGKITSRVADDENCVHFSFRDAGGTAAHTKERLMGYAWTPELYKHRFVEATPKNLQILSEIEREKEAIKASENIIEKLKAQFEKPVTWETIEQAAGEK